MKQFFLVFAILIWASYVLGAQSIGSVQEADGYRHLTSSVLFPLHDELTQRPMIMFNSGGTDVGVGYSHSTIPLEITLYVYPALHSLDDELTYAVNEIYSAHSPEVPCKSRVSVESSLGILGYSQEFRYIEDFRSDKQALVSTVEVYQHNGWFVMARMTVSHDNAPDGRRLVRELLDTMVWPQPIRALPITGVFTYRGEHYQDIWWGHFLSLVRMLQEEPRLTAETVEALVLYEEHALHMKRSLLWSPVLTYILPAAALAYIWAGEDRDRPFEKLSTGSYIAIGLAGASVLIGVGLLVYVLIEDRPPFREMGLVNRDLMGSR